MPPWLSRTVALIVQYGKRVPWATLWKVITAIVEVKPTVEKNLSPTEQHEFYGLLRKARSGADKARPWRNLSAKERKRLWELARKAAGFGK